MKQKQRKEDQTQKPRRPIRLITYGEFQQEVSAAREKVFGNAWSPDREEELSMRLDTIHRLIGGNGTAVPIMDVDAKLSREATGAINLLKRWLAKLPS